MVVVVVNTRSSCCDCDGGCTKSSSTGGQTQTGGVCDIMIRAAAVCVSAEEYNLSSMVNISLQCTST